MRVLALAAFVALLMSGCADRATPDRREGPAAEEQRVAVDVTSSHFLDVVVYVGRDGTWHRLGTVPGLGADVFQIPAGVGAPPGQYRLRVHAIGAPDRGDYVTSVIHANPGDIIELSVASVLTMSTWRLRLGS